MINKVVRVLLCDPEDTTIEKVSVEVEWSEYSSDLDVRKQIAAYIDADGRYYLLEDDSIDAGDGKSCDYIATVLPLRAYVDRCPNCGDQSEDTRVSAVAATEEGGRGMCTQCGVAFKIARM